MNGELKPQLDTTQAELILTSGKMNAPLSPQEKRLIEREFIAKEEAKERKKRFRRRVAICGTTAGVSAAISGILFGGFFIPLILKIIWIVCIGIYLGADSLVPSFSKDIEFYRHMNPWKDSFKSLSDSEDLPFAIALFGSYHVVRIILMLILL